jgi:hypothetical protein
MNHLILCVPCGSSGIHVGVLLTAWVFQRTQAVLFLPTRLLSWIAKAPFLVVGTGRSSNCGRTAREVRRIQVAVQHVVPAQTGDAHPTDRVHHRLHHAVAVKVKEQQVLDVDVRARASVRARDAKVGWLFAQVVVWMPLSHQYIRSTTGRCSASVQFWLVMPGTYVPVGS